MIVQSPRSYAIGIAILVVGIAVFLLIDTVRTKAPQWVTATVERGDVSQIVSISGFIEAKNTAQLAFPTQGVVTGVYAEKGQNVAQGDVLATLASSQLIAQRDEARAGLQLAHATYDKLIAGEDAPSRSIALLHVELAEQALVRTISEENAKIENARRILLSSGLGALSEDPNESATAPTVTGTYACENEGMYRLEAYRSNAPSGYSYRYTGLESGTSPLSTDQPAPLGSCGIYLQFSDGDLYGNSTWIIDVPNQRSSTYATHKNAYDLTRKQATNAIDAMSGALALTREETLRTNAAPRSEAVREAEAAIAQAKAKIAQIDAQLADRSIVAPFDGVITHVEILRGETAPLTPVITLLASDAFELKTRVPEIDITKLAVGQSVESVFDAQPSEILFGKVGYISPLARMIDGVAYFEAIIALNDMPSWIKSGLNADVDIIVAKKEDALRIPKRFLIEEPQGEYSVQIPRGNTSITTPVTPIFFGNDGFVEINGLRAGDIIIAP